jgi:phage shock protein E
MPELSFEMIRPLRLNTRHFALILALIVVSLILAACGGSAVVETGTILQITPQQYRQNFLSSEHFLVDVRAPEEYAAGHIEGAVNIPLDTISSRLDEFPTNVPVIAYCRSGNRSAEASQILANAGYDVFDMGGIIDWAALGYPIVQ